jgi:hypothetical protein
MTGIQITIHRMYSLPFLDIQNTLSLSLSLSLSIDRSRCRSACIIWCFEVCLLLFHSNLILPGVVLFISIGPVICHIVIWYFKFDCIFDHNMWLPRLKILQGNG